MKKTTKKSVSKASQRKPIRDLDVRPARGGAVTGSCGSGMSKNVNQDVDGTISDLFKHGT